MISAAATIFAPATAQGKAGIAVFRISGVAARAVLVQVAGMTQMPAPRVAHLAALRHPATGEILDEALVLWFPAPHSFTGEDVVELHTHGGRAVTQALVQVLSTLPSLRLAEPGEFTRRAFENGKMDLTEAEAIADLVHAETEAQRRQALRQMQGALGALYEDWRDRLTRILAYMEAAIDFADEDLPADLAERQNKSLRDLEQAMVHHLDDRNRGERLRDGFSIAILGAPNAGKSSLLNALARREAAIVSSVAGTTRDVIEVHLDLGGYPVMIADTAGLRESMDAIENEGIRRALERAQHADIKLLVFDSTLYPALDDATRALIDDDAIKVLNKIDQRAALPKAEGFIALSAQTRAGVPDLLQLITRMIEQRMGADTTPPLTQARHRTALMECCEHIRRALDAQALELRAEDVRLAARALGRITGRVDVEDLLDVIFRDFCIGK